MDSALCIPESQHPWCYFMEGVWGDGRKTAGHSGARGAATSSLEIFKAVEEELWNTWL